MANKTITDFTVVTAVAGTDEYETMQGGVTFKGTITKLATYLSTLAETLSNKTLVAPALGAATATSINKVAITAPATGSTIAISDGKTAAFTASVTVGGTDGKTVTVNNNLTLAGTDGTTITFQGTDTYIGRTTTDTLTNKRVTPRVTAPTDAATVTVNADTSDCVKLLTLSQATTFANPTGTPDNFGRLLLRVTSTSVWAITWGSEFRAGTTDTLPNATVVGTLYMWFIRNADATKWDFLTSKVF